jgi:hypothetical protein
VEPVSRDGGGPFTGRLPASLSWIGSFLSILPPDGGGGEGCTPGYWKQPQHFDSWPAPYDPSIRFSEVFDRTIRVRWSQRGKPSIIADPTLLQALGAKGGGINALARHAVAALLNAQSPDVSFDYSVAEVIALVQRAVDSGSKPQIERAKDRLADANEQGCPLH